MTPRKPAISEFEELRKQLRSLGRTDRAEVSRRYFKTGPGGYGAGDRFYGVTVGEIRKLSRRGRLLPGELIIRLLKSSWHEERHLALLILVHRFETGDEDARSGVYRQYNKNISAVNNWDLVDCSAPPIVGGYLLNKDHAPLFDLAAAKSLWKRRIAVMATHHFIKKDRYGVTLELAERLLHDREDLIHKAVGWMLREIGKRDLKTEEAFLKRFGQEMPRTMLRYAIERFPEERRKGYLRGDFF